MTLSQLIAAAQAAYAEHGDVPVLVDCPHGGFDPVVNPFRVQDVHACPEMAAAHWGDFDAHYPYQDDKQGFKALIL